MKPADYIDDSYAASEQPTNTVREILRVARVKLHSPVIVIMVLEADMPAAIKALFKAGFHRTADLAPPAYQGRLMLRRSNIIVELELPVTLFGSDQSVAKLRRDRTLGITPMCLTDEGKIAKEKEDALIDTSYESALLIYQECERLNDWRNRMQFTLPGNRQIVSFIRCWDRCFERHGIGSAVHYDRFVVTWDMSYHGGHAWLHYTPSSDSYEIKFKRGEFVWARQGCGFDYPEKASDLLSSLEHYLEAHGNAAECSSLSEVYRMMQSCVIPLD